MNIQDKFANKILNLERRKWSKVFDKRQSILPVYINNRDRFTTTKKLVKWLEQLPYVEIIILDNDSTYKPLLDWYIRCNHEVLLLKQNLGHCALWVKNCFAQNKQLQFHKSGDWYVYTDSDILPREDCPLNVLQIFKQLMLEFPYIYKVGFGLEIKDLPFHYPLREAVVSWESQFWCNRQNSISFRSNIDTTFALYNKRRYTRLCYDLPPPHHGHDFGPALRTDYPYIARHLPWYIDINNLDVEEEYYLKQAGGCASWTTVLRSNYDKR